MRATACVLLILSWFCPSSRGETYSVAPDGSGDFPTIQAALAGVVAGDVIELSDGVFLGEGNRDIDFMGRAVTVRSASGDPATCRIRCEGSGAAHHRGFLCAHDEDGSSVLEAVTIEDGYAEVGGGLLCQGSRPRILRCVFRANTAVDSGGGLACLVADPELIECRFETNQAELYGGGLYCTEGPAPTLSGCTFLGNSARYGAGAFLESPAPVEDCIFATNTGDYGCGLYLCVTSSQTVQRCLFQGQVGVRGAAVYL